MSDIKSAREIAMEKIASMGEATEEERLSWQYVPEGEKLAARYINEGCNLVVEMSHYSEPAKKYVAQGALDILVRNIKLPADDAARKNNKQAMDGIKAIKSDKVGVENVFSKIKQVFNHFTEQGEQQKQQAYQSLKAEYETRVKAALAQQLGTTSVSYNMDVEGQPQFQEEWRNLQSRLSAQYTNLLDEYKRELKDIS